MPLSSIYQSSQSLPPADRPIVSLKAFTPPSHGDLFLHHRLGQIKLIRRSGGTSWWASSSSHPNHQFEVNPAKLPRVYQE